MHIEKYTAQRFIDEILVRELRQVVGAGFPYYAFSLLCQGVELVGALFDGDKFEKNGLSENRFKEGLKRIFGQPAYVNLSSVFYSDLRGGLIHQLRPGQAFCLASLKTGASPDMHLKRVVGDGRMLIIEQLIDDFADGVAGIWKNVDKLKGQIYAAKLAEDFLIVASDQVPNADNKNQTWASSSTTSPSITAHPGYEERFSTYRKA